MEGLRSALWGQAVSVFFGAEVCVVSGCPLNSSPLHKVKNQSAGFAILLYRRTTGHRWQLEPRHFVQCFTFWLYNCTIYHSSMMKPIKVNLWFNKYCGYTLWTVMNWWMGMAGWFSILGQGIPVEVYYIYVLSIQWGLQLVCGSSDLWVADPAL